MKPWGGLALVAVSLILIPTQALAQATDFPTFVCEAFVAAITRGETAPYFALVAEDYLNADSQTREAHIGMVDLMAGWGARLTFSNVTTREEPRGGVYLRAAYTLTGDCSDCPRIGGTCEGRCRNGQAAAFPGEARWVLFWSKTTPGQMVPPEEALG